MQQIGSLIESGAFSLKHRVREPLPGAGAQGCLVLLHGVKENENTLAELALAQHPDVLVVLVRGPIEFRHDRFGWFTVTYENESAIANFAQAQASRVKLIQFLDQLKAAYGVSPERTVIAGFSQGGIMSTMVALTTPERVAGFGLLCGRILPELEPHLAPPEALSALSGFIAHGEYDTVLPLFWACRSRELLTRHNVKHDSLILPAGHEITLEMQAAFKEWAGRLLAVMT